MNLKNDTSIELSTRKILVTGANGFLGKYVVKKLLDRGVPKTNISTPTREELDLRKREDCEKAVKGQNIVIHLAARVGGIGFNKEHPGEAFYDNIMMGIQMIEASRQAGVEKFTSIGTVSEYPENTPVPFKEENLWDGYPGGIYASYGLAKKMMLVQAEAYKKQYGFNAIHLMFTNLYGPGDSLDPEYSHVIPGLVQKIVDAESSGASHIEIWGSGKATREFLYVEDAAEAIILATEKYDKTDPVNIGTGRETSIKEIVETICKITGYDGEIEWDTSKPEGQMRRQLDVSRAKKEFGFEAKTKLEEGLKKTVEWYREEISNPK